MTENSLEAAAANSLMEQISDIEDEEYDDDEDPNNAYLVVEEEAVVAVQHNSLYRGCLVVDTGCTCSVSSHRGAEMIHLDRISEEGNIWNECMPSDKTFGFGNGQKHKCSLQVAQ